MESERKDTSEEKKRRGSSKLNSGSPSVSGRAQSSTTPTSPVKSRKDDVASGDHAWISASVMKSPRGHQKSDSGLDPYSDDSDRT